MLLALSLAGLLAGCGGGSSKSTTAATTTSATATQTTGTTTGQSTSTASQKEIVEFVATACKRRVQRQLSLTTTEKTKLEAICDGAKNGDVAGVRKATEEVCVQILKSSTGLSSSAREQGIAACKKAK